MTADELKERISKLTIWKKDGQRAPHKPLLILYALGRLQNEKKISLPYEEVRVKLKYLLMEFGPVRKLYHPEEPFVRLVGDGIWELNQVVNKKKFSEASLLSNSITGGFTDEVVTLLREDRNLIQELATMILEEHFTDSMHDDILAEVGLQYRMYRRIPRDPHFRHRILIAYEYSCAVCGFNVQLGNQSVALEAAHIQWHQAGGPDREENGLALCSLHHKLFDRGVFMVASNSKLYVAESAHGSRGFDDWLMKFHDREIRSPINLDYNPNLLYINWHEREVFKGKARFAI